MACPPRAHDNGPRGHLWRDKGRSKGPPRGLCGRWAAGRLVLGGHRTAKHEVNASSVAATLRRNEECAPTIAEMKIVGLEEHFATPELIDAWQALEPQWRDV